MKKYLLLLLLATSFSYGQTTLANKLKITGNLTDNAATKVNVQSSDGTVNTISKVDLQDAFYFASASNFPVTGITDKLYIARDNNILYRFNGTIYVPLSADVSGKEDIANKSSSFTASSTVTYANTKALVDGLAGKQNTITGTTNVVPKFGSGGLVGSNITDDGILVSTNSDFSANGIRVGRGNGNNISNLGIGGGNFNAAITGTLNVAVGNSALFSNLGFANLAFGGEALYFNTTGSDNIGLGFQAGTFIANGTSQNTITASSIYLGSGTKPLGDNQTNQIVIGNMAIGAGSNTATLGNTLITSTILRGTVTAGTSIVSPNLTGTPTAPTATAGTNTTQIATTAFVLANAVTLTGSQTISGTKTFSDLVQFSVDNGFTSGGSNPVIKRSGDHIGVASSTLSGYARLNTKSINTSTPRTFTFPDKDGTFALEGNSPIQLKDFFTDINNVGTAETDLLTYTTLANRLNATGEKIVANYGGTFNDVSASSQLKIYFGGTVIGDTGALTMSTTGAWIVTTSIMRTGTTTARAIVNVSTPGASTASYTKYTSLTGLTFTNTNIIKITGTATGATGGNDDITATYGNIIWQPAAL